VCVCVCVCVCYVCWCGSFLSSEDACHNVKRAHLTAVTACTPRSPLPTILSFTHALLLNVVAGDRVFSFWSVWSKAPTLNNHQHQFGMPSDREHLAHSGLEPHTLAATLTCMHFKV
jgi:hypothetical protein